MRHKLLLIAGLFFLALPVGAQTPDPIQFIIAPETPGPGELVVIEVRGVGTFLGDATITWRKDGATEKQGVGEKTYSFTTGPLGSGTRIGVTVNSPSEGVISREFVFVPSFINLVWEADTYTPPLYRGKALYSAGSALKVAAFPVVFANGARLSSNSLSFQWMRGGEPVPQQSGLGRAILAFEGDQLQAGEDISVDAYYGANKVGHGEISIPTTDPEILFYERDSLRGVLYTQALPQIVSLIGKEIAVQAEPYFFSNNSRAAGELSFSWTLNGEQISGPDSDRGILVLRQTGEGGGEATLGVLVQNNESDRLTQQASALLQILFGQQASASSLSGLSAAVANFTELAQVKPGNLPTYQPLEPIPGLNQTGGADFGQLLGGLFRVLISLGALFAVVMLTVAGIEYMVSDVPGIKLGAKDRASAAILGLLILAGSVLLLQTINPKLVSFSNLLNPVESKPATSGSPFSVTERSIMEQAQQAIESTGSGREVWRVYTLTNEQMRDKDSFNSITSECEGTGLLRYKLEKLPIGTSGTTAYACTRPPPLPSFTL